MAIKAIFVGINKQLHKAEKQTFETTSSTNCPVSKDLVNMAKSLPESRRSPT